MRVCKAFTNSAVCLALVNTRVDSVVSKRLLEGVDAIRDLIFGFLKLFLSNCVELLRLSKFEFKLLSFSIALSLLILFPVFNSLLVPLLHEASVALQLVNLNSAHFLLAHRRHLGFFGVVTSCNASLALFLLLKLVEVGFHVELLLRLVQGVDAGLEELMLHLVVLFLGVSNFLGGLVVPKVARFRQHGNVCYRVDLLQTHLQLVEEAQGNASLALHDSVDHFGVELDIQVAQGRLQFLKVLQSVRDSVPKVQKL